MRGNEKMLFNKFVQLVENNSSEIADIYMTNLLKDPDCPSYKALNRTVVYNTAKDIFKDLSMWISKSYPKEKVKERYLKIGKDSYTQNIPPSEVHRSMILQKRFIWLYVIDDISNDMPAYEDALLLNNRVTLFFDRAIAFMLQGYESEINRGTHGSKKFF